MSAQAKNADIAAQRKEHPLAGFTPRAVLIGLALMPVNILFMLYGYIWGQSRPATVSLIFNVVISVLAVSVLSQVLGRLWKQFRLSPAELAIVYTMLTITGAVSGLDQVQTAVPVVAHPFWHATPENRWEELFLKTIPRWLTVDDPSALWAYFDSGMPLFATAYWKPWLRVSLVWSGITLLLLWVMLCLSTLLRRNWVEESKLSFPIAQTPLAIIDPRAQLFSSRLMWIGFVLALAIDLLNGLHQLYPVVPAVLGVREASWDLGQQLKSMPWRAIGWTPMNVYPFAVGLAFFIPLDLAFSSWFFYVYWKFVRIVSAALGWGNLPRAPWIDEQEHAAYQTLAVLCLWASRRQLVDAVRSALAGPRAEDAYEPLPYRLALLGAIAGTIGLVAIFSAAGMSVPVAAAAIGLYLGISIAVARIRAELGSPVHDLHKVGPEVIIMEVLGSRNVGRGSATVLAFFWAFNRAHRSHPMPHQIEPMKIAEQTGAGQRAVALALMLSCAIAVPMAWLVMIDAFCRYGGWRQAGKGYEAFNRLATWLTSRQSTNWYTVAALGVGAATTALLAAARMRWPWWPFHPAGYAVSGSWSMSLFAPSIFVSWLAKVLILRYGGLGSYRPASRFFMGMILGEFVAGTFWGTYGILKHRPMYNFLP
ncbi:MAG: hypothetical protein H5T86_12465 [Armatimonadetes bacterium]|nr:hypothetical protein [Armatimonadota bacterium]